MAVSIVAKQESVKNLDSIQELLFGWQMYGGETQYCIYGDHPTSSN